MAMATPAVAPSMTVPAVAGSRAWGVTVHLQAGQNFDNYLGDLAGNFAAYRSLRLSATIDWGDGSPAGSGIAFVGKTGNIDTGGQHAYAAGGTYSITVTVLASAVPVKGQPTPDFVSTVGQIHSTAVVSRSPQNSPGGVTLHESASVPYTASVGTFPLPPLSIFNGLSATIDWGDGKTSAGKIANGVTGTHTYAAAGTYPIVTRVYIISVIPPGVMDPPPPHPPELFRTIDSTAIVK
jgi:hypothetical protein